MHYGWVDVSTDTSGHSTIYAAFRSTQPGVWPWRVRKGCEQSSISTTSDPGDVTGVWGFAGENAGTVTASAGSASAAVNWVEAVPLDYYLGVLTAAPDAPVTVTATGGANVPPFSVLARMLAPLTITSPVDQGIAKNADFEVTWEPTFADEVEVSLRGKLYGGASCFATADAGKVVIPAALVQHVVDDADTAADGTPVVTLAIAVRTWNDTYVRDYDIEVSTQAVVPERQLVVR